MTMARYLVRSPLRLDGQLYLPGSMLVMDPERAKELLASLVLSPMVEPMGATQDPLQAAMDRLDPNQPTHWTIDGKPRIDTLSRILGRTVLAEERNQAWQARESQR